MKRRLLLEEKHDALKNGPDENLQKKHALELEINQQFEELQRLEISIEKYRAKTTEEYLKSLSVPRTL
jgi:hypothetical protein